MNLRFNEDCIKAHNELRSLHRARPLKFSKQLAEEAQEWAEKLAISGKAEHSDPRNQYGENLATCSRQKNAREFTLMWYKEIFDYKFDQERQAISKIGHFSQLVWSDSNDAGFGIANMGEKKGWVVVGRYRPQGNMIGRFQKNVGAPVSGWSNNKIIKELLDTTPNITYSEVYKKYASNHQPAVNSAPNENGAGKWLSDIFRSKKESPKEDVIRPNVQMVEETKPVIFPIDSTDKENEVLKSLRNMALDVHNRYRKKHRVKNLEINKELNWMAQEWAEKLASSQQLSYSCVKYNDTEVGENIALLLDSLTDNSLEKILEKWYDEKMNYSPNKEVDDAARFGHFTQMVWSNTKQMGMGASETENGQSILVIYYTPPGNVKGEFRENITV